MMFNTKLESALSVGLEVGCTEHGIEDYLIAIKKLPGLFFLPGGYSRRSPGVVRTLSLLQSYYFSIIDNDKSNTYRSLAVAGCSHHSELISTSHITELLDIAKYSRINYSSSIDSRCTSSANSWQPDAKYLQRIFNILDNYSEVSGIIRNNHLRLDRIGFDYTSNYASQSSTHWHRDLVGNRIKIFLILANAGSSPSTGIFVGSHRDPPHSKNIDLLRTNRELARSDILQSEIQALLVSKYGPSSIMRQKARDVCIIDTNCFHRANIPIMHSASSRYGKRLKLELEYMPTKASDFALFLGPCAPGQDTLLIHGHDIAMLKEFGFDPKCMMQFPGENEMLYSYTHSSRSSA